MNIEALTRLCRRIRALVLTATTAAGSGHPTSSMSAVELMAVLMFGDLFRFDIRNPQSAMNDRLIFSKGHASPLFYALWTVAGALEPSELMTMRKFGSRLEGHPAVRLPFTEAATGSLGQGLSIGLGMALTAKLDGMAYRTYVLLGDSEMAEGSLWEAMEIASYYKLSKLIGVLDVNRLGQRGPTMVEHDLDVYERRVAAFGWKTIVLPDGHDLDAIHDAYTQAANNAEMPTMIIAKTMKGKGVSFLEDKDGWHGKTLKKDELEKALAELGPIDNTIRGKINEPEQKNQNNVNVIPSLSKDPKTATNPQSVIRNYKNGDLIATRKAYGTALARLGHALPDLVVLDAEVSNSTFADIFKKEFPGRFFEMFIAEQNMVGAALGLARRGKLPFVSTFAAFLSRAFDQIRMSQYSNAHIVFCGSHAGVSIGEDGPSQMGLEDLAMFRSIRESIVLYPADAIATDKLVDEAASANGIVYLRTTRKETPVVYDANETFPIGGSKTLRSNEKDVVTVMAAGITLFEGLAAADELKKENVNVRVIDLYSVKPLDRATVEKAARETRGIITVEDHYPAGGLGEAVAAVVADLGLPTPVHILAVNNMPSSGTPDELLAFEEISKDAIIARIKHVVSEGSRELP